MIRYYKILFCEMHYGYAFLYCQDTQEVSITMILKIYFNILLCIYHITTVFMLL